MSVSSKFAEIAALAGDPARANMLLALMNGSHLAASVLARVAGVSPQTASGHLKQLAASGLLSVEERGRFRYYRLAGPAVAGMLEGVMEVAALLGERGHTEHRCAEDKALRFARTCYDHFAGRLGVAISDALVARGFVDRSGQSALLTAAGLAFLKACGIGDGRLLADGTDKHRRILCRACYDWSELRPHLGGAIGAAICAHSMEQGWTRRVEGSRAVILTPKGRSALRDKFKVTV